MIFQLTLINLLRTFTESWGETGSWGAKEHILYYCRTKKSFTVLSVLPRVDVLLKEIAETIFILELVEVPLVHGFMYKLHYVCTMRNTKSMALRDVEIQIGAVEDLTEIQKLHAGILYHLTYTYPVIDAIEYLKVNGLFLYEYHCWNTVTHRKNTQSTNFPK